MRRLRVAVVLFSLLAACTGSIEHVGHRPPAEKLYHPRPTFHPSSGWYLRGSDPVPASAPLRFAPVAWASTVPLPTAFREPMPGWGDPRAIEFLQRLPNDDIAIFVAIVGTADTRSNSHAPHHPSPPLLLRHAIRERRYEGQAAPQIALYKLRSQIEHQKVEVRVYFGSQNPNQEQISTAQSELSRLVISFT